MAEGDGEGDGEADALAEGDADAVERLGEADGEPVGGEHATSAKAPATMTNARGPDLFMRSP